VPPLVILGPPCCDILATALLTVSYSDYMMKEQTRLL